MQNGQQDQQKQNCQKLIIKKSSNYDDIRSNNDSFQGCQVYTAITLNRKQKTTDKSIGKIIKGASFTQQSEFKEASKHKSAVVDLLDQQLRKQIEILPKTKTNVNRKMKNKVIPSLTKGDQIILMESSVFPPVYFKKTSMRNVLKEFKFPQNVRALPPNDDRTPLIFQIIANLFNEITFYIFNILIGENLLTQSYYIFFSDSETIPFTKCCNAPVYVELMNNGSGKLLCNSASCPHSNLAEFLINFQDGRKLWKDITYFSQASSKDRVLRGKISKFISNGKYKRMSLVETVQETSKEIVELFYKSKKNNNVQIEDQFDDTPFLTAGHHHTNTQQYNQQKEHNNQQQVQRNELLKPLTAEDLFDTNDTDVDILKMKIYYLTRNQKELSKKLSRDIVRNGKVFQSDFDMIKKIDEIMLKKRNSRTTRISFPKIMQQYRISKYRQSKSKSFYEKKNPNNTNNSLFM